MEIPTLPINYTDTAERYSDMDLQFNHLPSSNASLDRLHSEPPHSQLSSLEVFGSKYMELHGVLSLLVCALGIPMNVLNVFVLTRQHMRTPVNTILTWLAVFDLLTMASYLPFSLHFYIFEHTWHVSPERNSLGWMTFLIFHVDFTATTHTISNWLAVILAIFRYKHIFLPAKGDLTRMRRLVRARLAVFSVVILSILITTPNFLMNRLTHMDITNPFTNETVTIYSLEPLHLGTPKVQLIAQINLWIYSTLAKIFPCVLMAVFSGLLLQTVRRNVRMISRKPTFTASTTTSSTSVERGLMNAKSKQHIRSKSEKRQRRRKTAPFCKFEPQKTLTPAFPIVVIKSRRPQDNARTTRMLLTIIILYVVTELPQAILIIASASVPDFFMDVYIPLGDILDMVALINNGINFVLYCAMSRDFRRTLLSFVKKSILRCPNKDNNCFQNERRMLTTAI